MLEDVGIIEVIHNRSQEIDLAAFFDKFPERFKQHIDGSSVIESCGDINAGGLMKLPDKDVEQPVIRGWGYKVGMGA
jgi:hypothetical protein